MATGEGAECVVIDPGKDSAAGVDDIVRQYKLKPVSVLVTHGHVDHMWCVAPVAGTYDATAWIHPSDRHLLTDPVLPDELLPKGWPGAALRDAYEVFAAELVARRDGVELAEVR